MARPITLFTGQWADLPFEEVARLAAEWGYDGLEIACWGDHLDVGRAAEDDDYVAGRRDDPGEARPVRCTRSPTTSPARRSATTRSTSGTAASCPTAVWGDGDPEGRAAASGGGDEDDRAGRRRARAWKTVVGFTGSSIWKYVAMFPPCPQEMIDAGYQDFADRWNPILDVFDEVGRAVRPRGAPERDRLRLLDRRSGRWRRSATGRRSGSTGTRATSSGRTWTRSGSCWDFPDRIYHVRLQGRQACRPATAATAGLGSHLPWADPRRGWDFVSHRARRRAVGGRASGC